MRFRRRAPLPRSAWVAALLVCLVAARLLKPVLQPPAAPFHAGPHRVERVVDGDTLVLAGGTRVRLIGVDAPEVGTGRRAPEPLGREAAEFVRRQVEGREVSLQFDRQRRDRYHRVLAYVYVDGLCLNEELIRAGYSRAETRFPYSAAMKRAFQEAEQEAREANRGIWANAGRRRDDH